MGDRSNIFFRNKHSGIGVYFHLGGYHTAEISAQVLSSKAFQARLGDANYATRIGVQIALEQSFTKSTDQTGCGLWTPEGGPDDNEHAYIVIDVNDGSVFVTKEWASPNPSERVENPSAALLQEKMVAVERA